jgi:hypothetical protein
VPLIVGDDGIPVVCLLCDLQQKWERKRDRLEVQLVRKELKTTSAVKTASVSKDQEFSSSRSFSLLQKVLFGTHYERSS